MVCLLELYFNCGGSRGCDFKSTAGGDISGCGFFAYSWKFPAYNGVSCLQLTILVLLLIVAVLVSLLTVGSFFAYSGKVRLIKALKDCKQKINCKLKLQR